MADPGSVKSKGSDMGKVWEIAITVTFLVVVGVVVGALIFVTRRRKRTARERQARQREEERRRRSRISSKEALPYIHEIAKPTPVASLKPSTKRLSSSEFPSTESSRLPV